MPTRFSACVNSFAVVVIIAMHPTITTLQAQLGKLRTDESIAQKGESASDQLRADGIQKEIDRLESKLKELIKQTTSTSVYKDSSIKTAYTENEGQATLEQADIKLNTDEVHQAADALKSQEVAAETTSDPVGGFPVPSAPQPAKNKIAKTKVAKKVSKKTSK